MSKTRLVMALASAGVPVDTVAINGNSATVTYMEGATQLQRDQGASIISDYDWSPEAEATWAESQRRGEAKRLLTASDPMPLATRAACLALMISLQECRAKVNELVTAVNTATGAGIVPLRTGDSLATAMEQVAQLLDAGAV